MLMRFFLFNMMSKTFLALAIRISQRYLICLLICLFIYLFICLFIYLFIYLSPKPFLPTHRYVIDPFVEKPHLSLDGKPLDKGLVDLTKVASVNREMVFEEVLINGKPRADLPLTTLYVTQEEREAASQLTNIKKADLVKMAENLVAKLTDDSLFKFFKEKLALVQKRLTSTKKEVIISIYEEISKLVDNNELDQQQNEHEHSQGDE